MRDYETNDGGGLLVVIGAVLASASVGSMTYAAYGWMTFGACLIVYGYCGLRGK